MKWIRMKLVMLQMNTLCCKKYLFYFEQFNSVRTYEDYLIRDVLYKKTHFIFPTLVLILCSFHTAGNANIVGNAF